MPRNTAVGKAAAGPANASDEETINVSTPQAELAAANAEIDRIIKDKESELGGQESELTDEELVE
jgi:hypothetical protein